LEKIFNPNKWFVAFCALLIAVFAGLQFVVSMRLEDLAKGWCKEVYTWDWPPLNMHSSIKITDAQVVKRGENDAVVKVHGVQTLKKIDGGADGPAVVTKCGAQLTFYKKKNDWFLGRVELQD
jgi:hypothetical protein